MPESEAMKRELAANAIEGQAPSEALQAERQAIGDAMNGEWQAETGDAGAAIIKQCVAAEFLPPETPMGILAKSVPVATGNLPWQ